MERKTTKESTGLVPMKGEPFGYILPSPRLVGDISLEETLSNRRSHRSYQGEAITANDLSQVLWAAYGVTLSLPEYYLARGGFKTAPSAGATYPLEVYAVVGNVKEIKQGVYKYISEGHQIIRIIDRDIRADLSAAALNQEMIEVAPACLFFSAVFRRTTGSYGLRGYERYVCMDLGHSAQNVYLQAEALHLGTCAIGAFNDEKVSKAMQLPEEEKPLYIMPIGKYIDKPEY